MRRPAFCSHWPRSSFETRVVHWTPEFLFALGWLVLVLSFGAIWLLYFLIRRSAATRVVSLFYLTPPVTALMAWLLFDERLAPLALLGMAICVAGVFLVNWRARWCGRVRRANVLSSIDNAGASRHERPRTDRISRRLPAVRAVFDDIKAHPPGR